MVTKGRNSENEIEIPVKDRSGDRWIRIIGLVALFTFPLVGTIGKLILNKMDEMSKIQTTTIKTLNHISVSIGTYGDRITRSEKDITEINVKVDGISKIVYKLEGAK